VAGGGDSAHQVDPPDLVPLAVGGFDAGPQADPGVGAVEVDRAVVGLHLVDQRGNGGVVGDVTVGASRRRPDGCRRIFGAGAVPVGEDDRPGAFGSEAPAESGPDAAGPAGDDDDLVLQLHIGNPSVPPPKFATNVWAVASDGRGRFCNELQGQDTGASMADGGHSARLPAVAWQLEK